MLLLLPLGSEKQHPRPPYVTLALVVLNALVYMATRPYDVDKAEAQETELEQVAETSLRSGGDRVPALAARFRPPALVFLEQDDRWREELAGTELRERLESCLEDARALRASHPFYRFGFVPADITPLRLLAHQFLHAGLLHLGFNMLFLWTIGGLLERTLGMGLFAAAYLAGGAAAAFAYAATSTNSTEPAVGASGAVAAVMGAFAVLHARERLRLALVVAPLLAPRIYFVSWPAAAFLGLWLLEQLFFASFGWTTMGVAFAAHLGGFAFGLLVGLVVRMRGPAAAYS